MKVPPDTNLDRLTWVTNTHVKPDRVIYCPVCHGIIMFNAEELLARRAAGQSTSTPCRVGEVEDWHPGWPPDPWTEYDGTGFSKE
jgi:hypothetical protein